MSKGLTERQKGIAALRDLFLRYNVIVYGDDDVDKAYERLMKKEGITLGPPTEKQNGYVKQLREVLKASEELTERQKGIVALRDLMFKHNAVFFGDEGLNKAYEDFMKQEGIRLKPPTDRQNEYEKQLREVLKAVGTTKAV